MDQLICQLDRLGMTALHRVGLAGLYMTLEACDQDPAARSAITAQGFQWRLSDRSVGLKFAAGQLQAGLNALLAYAFQVDKGFFKLPGLERGGVPSLEHKWLLYQALLGSFLQHQGNRTKGVKEVLAVEIDDKQLWIKDFAPVSDYSHQKATKDFLGRKGFKPEISLAGWLYPGGAQRHVAWGKSALSDPPELAMCLLFAPVGAIYFLLSSHRRHGKARTAIVLPQVRQLAGYARLRRFVAQHGVLALTAASPTDAALQVALLARSHDLALELGDRIRVLTYGIVPWNKNQKSRTAVCTVTPSELAGLDNYALASAIFRNRWQLVKAKTDRRGQVKEPAHYFVRPYTARELIADNVANRRPWFAGFADYMSDRETRLPLQFERQELFQMTQEAAYDHPRERIFITTCHEAWRRRLGQLGERARRERISFSNLASGDYERLRMALVRCKNATTLRGVLTDFWARGGSLKSLQENWSEVLPLLDEPQWRTARDLALLALASYRPTTPEEGQALTDIPHEEEGMEP